MFTGRTRRFPAALVGAVLLLVAAAGNGLAVPLRVATFNIKEGLGAPGSADFENTAAVLGRIGADVVALQEINENDQRGYVEALGLRLGLPHIVYEQPAVREMRSALLSRHPLAENPRRIDADGMSRPIILARIAVPGASRAPWIAALHLKCCDDDPTDHHRRAVELYHLRRNLVSSADFVNDPVVVMGDFNLVVDNDRTYTQPRYRDVPYPLFAPASADGYFVDEEIFKLDARHAGGGGERWTWRSNGRFPDRDLDHIMVNAKVRSRGTAAEVYDIVKDASGIPGLRKYGTPPPPGTPYVSDHLPVFADIDLDDGTSPPPTLAVTQAAIPVPELPLGSPVTAELAGQYILENAGSSTLRWSADCEAPWLDLSARSGTLPAGGRVVIEARLGAAAGLLPVGLNRATVLLRNESNGFGNTAAQASVLIGTFVMDGMADAVGYTVSGEGITLRAAVRGTRLYVATSAPPDGAGANDHHVFVSSALLPSATSPSVWAKRGSTALPEASPYLAAEGASKWSGWFNAPARARLYRSPNGGGVLEGSIDLVESFGTVPEFIYIAAVAYETSDASAANPALGRVISQVPAAVVADDDITPEEFLRIPVRSITDSTADGRFDAVVPERGFAAEVLADGSGVSGVRWKTVPGRTYRVWRSESLVAGGWKNIGTKTAGPHEWQAEWPDDFQTRITSKTLFYRVELIDLAD